MSAAVRWGLSVLDWRSHAINEHAEHPLTVLRAECGHLLMMVTALYEKPSGIPCKACAALRFDRAMAEVPGRIHPQRSGDDEPDLPPWAVYWRLRPPMGDEQPGPYRAVPRPRRIRPPAVSRELDPPVPVTDPADSDDSHPGCGATTVNPQPHRHCGSERRRFVGVDGMRRWWWGVRLEWWPVQDWTVLVDSGRWCVVGVLLGAGQRIG